MLTNERGELTVDPMTGAALVNGEKGRPLPWLDVPGFTPPQVQKLAAETIAKSGIVVSLPMPNAPQTGTQVGTGTQPASAQQASAQTTQQQAIPADARPVSEVMKADSAKRAAEASTATQPKQTAAGTQAGAAPVAQSGTAQGTAAPTTQPAIVQPPKPQAAMPKDDDWDLPENFNSKNAFVPIEADAD
jgi:hypothetical protein